MFVGNLSRIPKLSLFFSSIKTEAVLFFFIHIYISIFRKQTFIYACIIKKNGTLVVYYLFACVFIFPN